MCNHLVSKLYNKTGSQTFKEGRKWTRFSTRRRVRMCNHLVSKLYNKTGSQTFKEGRKWRRYSSRRAVRMCNHLVTKLDTKTGSQTKTDMIITRGKARMCNHLMTRKSETRMTASVLKQDTNTYKVKKNAICYDTT